MTDEDVHELENVACPGAGACGGQFTANTMAMVIDFLGLSPRAPLGDSRDERQQAGRRRAPQASSRWCSSATTSVRPQILTRDALRERDRLQSPATGGSTNGVLHLLAIAREAGIPLELEDFDRIADAHADRRRPEAGRPVRRDRHARGRRSWSRHARARRRRPGPRRARGRSTATRSPRSRGGRRRDARPGGRRPVASTPIKPTGGLAILRGSLAPGGQRREARRSRAPLLPRPGARLRLRGGLLRSSQGARRSSPATWS